MRKIWMKKMTKAIDVLHISRGQEVKLTRHALIGVVEDEIIVIPNRHVVLMANWW